MCAQFTLHQKFRFDIWWTKFEHKGRRYSSRVWILRTKNTEIRTSFTSQTTFGTVQVENVEKTQDTVYWVDMQFAVGWAEQDE